LAQVNFAIHSSETPLAIASSMDSNLANSGATSPCVFMNDHWALKQIDVFSLDLMGTVFTTTTVTAQGQQGGGATPIDSALVVTLTSLLPGRSNRGRQYWPGIDKGFLIAGGARWDPGAVSGAPDSFAALKAGLNGDNLVWQINSRKNQTMVTLEDFRVNTYIGSQRRRAERFM
jgi:hypothetical protein